MNEQVFISESEERVIEIEGAKLKVAVSVENLPVNLIPHAQGKLTAMVEDVIKNIKMLNLSSGQKA